MCLLDLVEDIQAECTVTAVTPKPLCRPAPGVSFWDLRGQPTRQTPLVMSIYLKDAFTGTTETGLGVGTSLACWLTELGTPSSVELARTGDRFTITELRWEGPWVWAHAEDGRVHKITLVGNPREKARLMREAKEPESAVSR
jgi:hypothetical protein